MLIRRKINSLLATLRRVPKRYYCIVGVVLIATLYIVAFRERTLAYNYGGQTCDNRLVVFPGLFKQSDSTRYKVEAAGGWSVLGKRITATSLCVTPTEAPSENSSETLAYAPWGGWLARLTYKVEAPAYPAIDMSALDRPIPVSRDLILPLSEPDVTFSYSVEAEDRQALCESTGRNLTCDVPALELKQGSRYTLALEKSFKEEVITEVASASIETLSPLTVVESSIKNDAVVYDRPKTTTITVDKPLDRAEFTAKRVDGDAPTPLEVKVELDGHQATIEFIDDLPRQAVIELKAEALEANDGSTPLDPYVIKFETSGGPKVTGVNVGSAGVAIGSQIIVSFDQELSAEQDLAPLVAAGGAVLQARRGNQLVFSTANVGRCQDISITLKPDIKSPYDISGQSAWQYKGRTLCYTVSTIGYSVRGRAISAYQFGSGGAAVVYTGAIHGNEASTKSLMDRWIQELDANPSKIPGDKRIIIIPAINPDGLASGSRTNANNVDLNRNFATGDWQKDIQHVNGSAFPGGGGNEAMSEPETKAIANFIAQQRPALVLSFHSIGGMVISNQSGIAGNKASQYASLSGYRLSGGGGGEFGYQITGTADDYYREKLGVASILIELGSHSYHQFERNQSALWAAMQ